jgi:hypothetical protein
MIKRPISRALGPCRDLAFSSSFSVRLQISVYKRLLLRRR